MEFGKKDVSWALSTGHQRYALVDVYVSSAFMSTFWYLVI